MTIRDGHEEAEKMKARTIKGVQEQEARAKKRMDRAASVILKEVFNL